MNGAKAAEPLRERRFRAIGGQHDNKKEGVCHETNLSILFGGRERD